MASNVKRKALKDISTYMVQKDVQIKDEHGDVWVVTASRLDCYEQRKLNSELGVSKVNYFGNTNGKKVVK